MNSSRLLAVCLAATIAVDAAAQATAPAPQLSASKPAEQTYTVFLRSRPIGQENVSVARTEDGWLIRGSSRLGAPIDIVTRTAEIHYTSDWRPTRLQLEGTTRGQEVVLKTTFANGDARSEISVGGTASTKTDTVAADTLVLPNAFLGSYAALARRLIGQAAGAAFRGYIAPQGEVPIRLEGTFSERIETPQQAIAATRYALVLTNPPPGGDLPMSVWTDAAGTLLRMSIPSQGLEVAREDVASAAARTTAFSLPGDESVRIPASGFSLGASITKPAGATRPLPAVVLIGGSGPLDREGFVAGIPVLGHIARALVDAGFIVVRFDKRGVGQSGGRTETATISDYADDVRAIVTWLEKQRKDVDRRRIALVGHSEGAWVALLEASRDRRVAAVATLAGGGSTGAELVLEQQRRALAQLGLSDEDRASKIALQERVHAAALKGVGWEGIPNEVRAMADTPWFGSFLAFDPARVIDDVRQPLLVLQGELDTQVPPHHADRLAELARARDRKATVDVVKVPGVNHLFVPANTGEVSEYATLPERQVSSIATAALAAWLTRQLR
jgi:uncharacterized protein